MNQYLPDRSGSSQPTESRPGGHGLLAIGTGLLIGIPVSVLLSFAGLLPFYLGPFFFLLFGLAVGAAMFRVAKTLRPIAGASIIVASLIVTFSIHTASLAMEYWQLGPHAGKMVAKKTRALPPGVSPAEFRAEVGKRIREHLAVEYSPGGLIGYVRWASTDGRFQAEVPGARPPTAMYQLSQSPVGWSLRVATSLILLWSGILSQVLGLRRPETEAEASSDHHLEGAEASGAG